MLTGQVFAVLSGAADRGKLHEIVRAVDWYLDGPTRGGYCLNTDFGEVKLDMGRMFGFAYGSKENGAVFSHMGEERMAMFDEKGRYIIRDYQSKPAFSSFLPGIAGPMGVPVWCYYNNRGQAVCSFGARDRDHAIMEFSPAYCAYRDVARRGFRTFCRVNGAYRELFTAQCEMHIGPGELEISSADDGLEASALYFGLPGERTAALVRVLTVRNASGAPLGSFWTGCRRWSLTAWIRTP